MSELEARVDLVFSIIFTFSPKGCVQCTRVNDPQRFTAVCLKHASYPDAIQICVQSTYNYLYWTQVIRLSSPERALN